MKDRPLPACLPPPNHMVSIREERWTLAGIRETRLAPLPTTS
ncbi:MAG TPA: hypothetical protein VHG28_17380 [Longimicrobiaceae bacterium]|nr:hypothetical protein [Longimicrobiaceae bacterium]